LANEIRTYPTPTIDCFAYFQARRLNRRNLEANQPIHRNTKYDQFKQSWGLLKATSVNSES